MLVRDLPGAPPCRPQESFASEPKTVGSWPIARTNFSSRPRYASWPGTLTTRQVDSSGAGIMDHVREGVSAIEHGQKEQAAPDQQSQGNAGDDRANTVPALGRLATTRGLLCRDGTHPVIITH